MPIKFRCKFCNQLMGIAHRKAGTEVECPTCKGKVLVPQTSSEPVAAPPPSAPPLFERSDFGDFLNGPQHPEPIVGGVAAPAPLIAPPASQPRPVRLPSNYDVEVEPMPGTMGAPLDPNAVGIVLSPGRATLLTVAVILGFALAFSAGLLVGRAL